MSLFVCMRRLYSQIVGARLPMDPQSEALFTETSDGLILCKLINLAEFDTIDPRSVRTGVDSRCFVPPGAVQEREEGACRRCRTRSLLSLLLSRGTHTHVQQ